MPPGWSNAVNSVTLVRPGSDIMAPVSVGSETFGLPSAEGTPNLQMHS